MERFLGFSGNDEVGFERVITEDPGVLPPNARSKKLVDRWRREQERLAQRRQREQK